MYFFLAHLNLLRKIRLNFLWQKRYQVQWGRAYEKESFPKIFYSIIILLRERLSWKILRRNSQLDFNETG